MTEQWKDIEGYEGLYQVSNLGRVKSLARVIKDSLGRVYKKDEFIKSYSINKNGYLNINLSNKKSYKKFLVHRLVATAFIPNLKNKPEVNHKNGIKTDNRVENLEWNTRQENVKHALVTGLNNFYWLKGRHKKSRKLTDEQVKDIRYFRKALGWGAMKLSKYLGIKECLIRSVIYANLYKTI